MTPQLPGLLSQMKNYKLALTWIVRSTF
jgi:hypothetical protein